MRSSPSVLHVTLTAAAALCAGPSAGASGVTTAAAFVAPSGATTAYRSYRPLGGSPATGTINDNDQCCRDHPFRQCSYVRGRGGGSGSGNMAIGGGGTTTTSLQMGLRSFIKRKVLRRRDEPSPSSSAGSAEESSTKKKKKKKKKEKSKVPQNSSSSGSGATTSSTGAAAASSSAGAGAKKSDPSSSGVVPADAAAGAGAGSSPIPSTLVETFGGQTTSNKSSSSTEKKASLGRDPSAKPSSSPIRQPLPDPNDYEEETVQDRINRVKSGRMSEEEKRAFLQTALTDPLPRAGDGMGGRPIRQALPDERGGGGGGVDNINDIVTKAGTPGKFPTGPLWSSVIGTNAPAPGPVPHGSTSWRVPVSKALDEDEKKRYLESVMNPERFSTYGYKGEKGMDEEAEDEEGMDESGMATEGEMKEEAVAEVEPSTDTHTDKDDGESEEKEEEDSNEGEGEGEKGKSGIFGNLASRLEAAAHAKETAAREARDAAERKRIEAARRREEEFKVREQEMKRRMKADVERKRAEEARLRAEREEVERAERERMEEMQRRQDDYWSAKLEKERELREEELKRKKREEEEEKKDKDKDDVEALERRGREEVARAVIREEERAREDPHEGDILKEAEEDRIHDRELTRSIMDNSAARVTGANPPTSEDVSASAFVNEQQRKKAELDRIVREQQERLKSLNSPLPVPGDAPRVVAPSPAPRARNTPSSAKSLAELTSLLNKNNAAAADAPPPAPAPATQPGRVPSLAEMTRLKKGKDEAPPQPRLSLSDMTRLKKDAVPPPSSAAPPAPTPSLADMTRLKKDGPTAAGRSKRGVVRQQLPLEDDDDETDYDGDDFLRNGPNQGMSIGDVMQKIGKKSNTEGLSDGDKKEAEKNKARMWGIDMDKYN